MADSQQRRWEPSAIAEHDQLLDEARTELDRLLRTVQIRSGDVGPLQAMADVGAMLMEWDKSEVLSVLLAAMWRIREGDSDG